MRGDFVSETEMSNISSWQVIDWGTTTQQLPEQWDRSQGSWADWMDAREEALAARRRRQRTWLSGVLLVVGVALLSVITQLPS